MSPRIAKGDSAHQFSAQHLAQGDGSYPATLLARLGLDAPVALVAVGPLAIIAHPKTALFCSARTPGDAILRAHDIARTLREEGRVVISGFHSPIEKECLKILLRGRQPIILCLARAIDNLRIPAEFREALEEGRMLFLSPFTKQPRRATQETAQHRNEFVAALADDAYVAHVTPGGKTEAILGLLKRWQVPIRS